jgi:purine-binding chemotaxis protein CheW
MTPFDYSPAHPSAKAFLSFQLGGLEYGVDFGKVKELRSLKTLERFSSDGTILSGVALSRGVIMPIVDMRAAVDLNGAAGAATDVIILQLSTCVMGMVVDGITDVVQLAPHQIAPIPGMGERECTYLMGVGECDGRRLILVDIEALMSIERGGDAGVAVA